MAWWDDLGNTLNNFNPGFQLGRGLATPYVQAFQQKPSAPMATKANQFSDTNGALQSALAAPTGDEYAYRDHLANFGANSPYTRPDGQVIRPNARPDPMSSYVMPVTDRERQYAQTQRANDVFAQNAARLNALQYKRPTNYWTQGNAFTTGANNAAAANFATLAGNARDNAARSYAMNGIDPSSGIQAETDRAIRMQQMQGEGAALNANEQDRLQRYAGQELQSDQAQQAFDQYKAEALNRGGVEGLGMLQNLEQQQWNNGQQAPMNALKLQQGQFDLSNAQAEQPYRLGILGNQQQAGGLDNRFANDTYGDRLGAFRAQTGYEANNYGGMNDAITRERQYQQGPAGLAEFYGGKAADQYNRIYSQPIGQIQNGFAGFLGKAVKPF